MGSSAMGSIEGLADFAFAPKDASAPEDAAPNFPNMGAVAAGTDICADAAGVGLTAANHTKMTRLTLLKLSFKQRI
jgi:hypothetical protein